MSVVLLLIAIFFNCYWVWYLYTKNHCRQEMKAVYLGKEKFRGGTMGDEFILLFQYEIAGKVYKEKSFETYRKKQVKDKYLENAEYMILVNEKHPQYYVLDHKIQAYDVLLIAVGFVSAALFLIFIFNK